MRQIEKEIIEAIKAKKDFSKSNSFVIYSVEYSAIYLHRNRIAKYFHETELIQISSCGWLTNTTKSRLNAILSGLGFNVRIIQKNYNWYIETENGLHEFKDNIVIMR